MNAALKVRAPFIMDIFIGVTNNVPEERKSNRATISKYFSAFSFLQYITKQKLMVVTKKPIGIKIRGVSKNERALSMAPM